MPAMSRIEALALRSAPWRAFATRVVLPWALGDETLEGTALEVGSGSGATAAAILDRFPALHLTATDYDPGMVLDAARRLARYGDRATAARADASRLTFADDTFDVALSFLMLHHVGNWEAALGELARVVKPGGRVIGCDLLHSRLLAWSERTLGSGEERLISMPEFSRRVAELPVKGWHTQQGHLPVFRFVLTVGPHDLARAV